MGKNGIPDRWLSYSPMGSIVPGTRFIACKVPLKDALLQSLPEKERFGPKDLLKAFPNIGLLIDLTNTTRYYSIQEFTDNDIRYEKIFCPGHVIPPNSIIKRFYHIVSDYLAKQKDPDAVIVVHCTHGVNRTGYFISRYMIEKLDMSPDEALKNFQRARGHDIERDNYVGDLKNGCKGGNESDLRFVPSGRNGRRDGRRQMENSKRGFRGANRNDERPEKRNRNDRNQTSNDKNRDRQWSDTNQRQKYFNKIDGKQVVEEDSKYSYNWRNHGKNQPPYQSTRPPFQFSPAHRQVNHQGSSKPPYQPSPFQFSPAHRQVNHQGSSKPPYQPSESPHHQEPRPVTSYDGARYPQREPFKGPPPEGFREPPYNGFSPLPTFCFPNQSMEAVPPSRLADNVISHPQNSHYFPVGHNNPSSGFRGHFRGRISSRGRGSDRSRGSFNRGRSSNRGRGPQRNNFSI